MSPGLHRIPCRIGAAKPLYQHLIAGEEAWLWVDTGIADTPDEYLASYVERQLPDRPRRHLVLITHPDVDHFGGIARLREQFPSAVVMAHRLDVPLISDRPTLMSARYLMHAGDGITPSPERQRELDARGGATSTVEIHLNGGEILDLGSAGRWEVLHLPGHSAGHLGVWEPGRRQAIIGDAVLGWGVPDLDGNLLGPPPYFDVRDYLRTVDHLDRLGIETLHTSHYPLMSGAEIGAFLESCRSAVAAIAAALADTLDAYPHGATLSQLCQGVGAAIGRWPEGSWPGLADPISGHLAQGIAEGRLSRRTADGVYRPVAA